MSVTDIPSQLRLAQYMRENTEVFFSDHECADPEYPQRRHYNSGMSAGFGALSSRLGPDMTEILLAMLRVKRLGADGFAELFECPDRPDQPQPEPRAEEAKP